MNPDDIFFSTIKESRGWYFVEYTPPSPRDKFSNLHLSITDESENPIKIAEAIEDEAKYWLSVYPIPLMATAFTLDGSVLSLTNIKPIDHLLTWIDADLKKTILRWELVRDADLPEVALDQNSLKGIFFNVPFRAGKDIEAAANKYRSTLRSGWRLFFIWAVVVPVLVAFLEWWSDLLGVTVLIYAFFKASIQALRLTGRLPKSEQEKAKEIKEGKMNHYYYHCERNPEAFQLLKLENFRNEEIERTRLEANRLKSLKKLHQ